MFCEVHAGFVKPEARILPNYQARQVRPCLVGVECDIQIIMSNLIGGELQVYQVGFERASCILFRLSYFMFANYQHNPKQDYVDS